MAYVTPTKREDPRNKDPEKPAAEPREEAFCKLCARGYSATKAYQIAVNPKASRSGAASRASEYRSRRDLAARIIALQANPDLDDGAPERPPEDADEPLTKEDLARIISQAVRQATTATEKTQAVKLAKDLLGLDEPDEAELDPVALVAHVAQAAGREPDAGSLRAHLERVAEWTGADRETLRRTLRAWLRDTAQDTEQPETQASCDLLPDGQSDNASSEASADTESAGSAPRPPPGGDLASQ